MTREFTAMTMESVREQLERAGAEVLARSGRSESYGAPRDFSFEVKGVFPNGLGLHIVARQFNYHDPWEAKGRINEMVDVSLLRNGRFSPLPKGYPFFQDTDMEEQLVEQRLEELIQCVKSVNPKLYELQKLTGDL